MNRLRSVQELGQSIWLDYIRRKLITSGGLERMIEEDGVSGVTSNPAIFEMAISAGDEYQEQLEALQKSGLEPMAIFEKLAIEDIRNATDAFRGVYDATGGCDGFVSLEVSPYLAYRTEATIEEARRLWREVGRDNLMIKVPATPEGIPAIEQLTSEGINVNTTLLFARDVYESVARAYVSGLEKFAAGGGDPSRVAAVASFFVSRIDSAADSRIEKRIAASSDQAERDRLASLRGKIAIANARLAYGSSKAIFSGARWEALAAKGARPQRLLWASTGTKNPAYSDVLYVEELIGADTVNTLAPATLEAFRDHGRARAALEEGGDEAAATLATLEEAGISLKEITDMLVEDGVRKFAAAFDGLLNAVDPRCKAAESDCIRRQTYHLAPDLEQAVKTGLDDWSVGKVRRLWSRDASLWTGDGESDWLGWLAVVDNQRADAARFTTLAAEMRDAELEYLVLLGMGGSSLFPEVLAQTFGRVPGFPELKVLDSTDPAQVRTIEAGIDLEKTVFIVASKSGTTLEPNVMKDYFYGRLKEALGAEQAGSRFVAITDPGSKLEQIARDEGFRHILHGVPSIGGRFSALSNFGMGPGALMGVGIPEFLDRTNEMVSACSPCVPAGKNPGVVLGVILGTLANHGRDKVTIVCSPGIHDLGAWLEQLLAESTGKQGKALIPVDRELLASPGTYGSDRVFVYLRLDSGPAAEQDEAIAAVEKAGQPVVRIAVRDIHDLGQEIFRWEIATAVAGSVMGVNPFNQPDVEASKVATRTLTDAYEAEGALPAEEPILASDGVKLFTDEANARAIEGVVGGNRSLAAYLRAHLGRLTDGDYCALLAYIEMNEAHEEALQRTRNRILEARRVATCLGFGPRFLHSTGQAYKGGPNTGVFLQITCEEANDLPIPGRKATFGVVKAAQARGDFQVLAERGRRVLRVHLGPDVAAGLAVLDASVARALSA